MEYKVLISILHSLMFSWGRGGGEVVTLPRDVTALGYYSHPALLDIILLHPASFSPDCYPSEEVDSVYMVFCVF